MAGIDQMLIWEIEGAMWSYLIPQLDNFANQVEFTFGQKYFL
jgi:hypothetical protein